MWSQNLKTESQNPDLAPFRGNFSPTCYSQSDVYQIWSAWLHPFQRCSGDPNAMARCARGVPKHNHAPLRYFVIHGMWLAMVYIISEVSSFTHSKLTEGVENLKIRPLDPDHACLGYFIICEMGHAKIYPCTKFEFEVSSFTCSKDMVAVPMQLLDARGGVPKLTRGSLSFFTRPPPNLVLI